MTWNRAHPAAGLRFRCLSILGRSPTGLQPLVTYEYEVVSIRLRHEFQRATVKRGVLDLLVDIPGECDKVGHANEMLIWRAAADIGAQSMTGLRRARAVIDALRHKRSALGTNLCGVRRTSQSAHDAWSCPRRPTRGATGGAGSPARSCMPALLTLADT